MNNNFIQLNIKMKTIRSKNIENWYSIDRRFSHYKPLLKNQLRRLKIKEDVGVNLRIQFKAKGQIICMHVK